MHDSQFVPAVSVSVHVGCPVLWQHLLLIARIVLMKALCAASGAKIVDSPDAGQTSV